MDKNGPCPFCGYIPWESSFDYSRQFKRAVKCDNCGAVGPPVEQQGVDYHECEEKARAAWNKRAMMIQVDARNMPKQFDDMCPHCGLSKDV